MIIILLEEIMAGDNSISADVRADLKEIEDEFYLAQGVIDAFSTKFLDQYMDNAIASSTRTGELIAEHGISLIDQEKERQKAVADSTKTEEERNEVLEEGIELETELMETQKLSADNMKQIGKAALDAAKSISGSILEIKRKEAEEKKALIDQELENNLSAL